MVLALVCISAACGGEGRRPLPSPEVLAVMKSFDEALSARDLETLKTFFADSVLVSSEAGFAGASLRPVPVSRDQLTDAYARLFTKLGPEGWKAIVENRTPLTNQAKKDGHHADFAKTGDYVHELGRSDKNVYSPILVYLFQRVDGSLKLVGQQTPY